MEKEAALTGAATPTDEALLAAVAARDPAALASLYDRFASPVFALALRIVGDRAIAEEVTQEIFVRVWRHAGSFDPARGRGSTWIMGVTHHLAVDQVRRRRTQAIPMPTTDEGESLDAHIPDPAEDVEAAVSGAERRRVLRATLRHLPATQREVIEGAYIHGLTQVEIASRSGIPLGTVKTRLRLGLRKMRDILQSQGLTPATI